MNSITATPPTAPTSRATPPHTLLVALLILVCLAATAWMRPLQLPDEGRYVGVAWEMMRSGDWLTPTLNGLPFFHKPPLFYWITASSMSVFGVNEWAGRAAPLLGAWLGAFSLFLFVRRWAGDRTANYTLLALLAQPLWFVGGQFANLDMLVAGCISATILLLAHAAMSKDRGLNYRQALIGAYAMAALGILAKGLIGAVLPTLVVIVWLGLTRRWKTLWAMVSLPGMVVFLVLAAPWFIAMQQRFPEFLDYFFVVQHFKRFAASGFNNVQPFWFYPAVLMLASLPCLPWLQRIFRATYWSDAKLGPVRLMMWIWLVVIVAFFSMPKSKLVGYVLPVVPALVFLLADGFASIAAPSRRSTRLWWTSVAVSAVISLTAVIGLALFPMKSSPALFKALGAQRGVHEPVFMLDHFDYNAAFYARIMEPSHIVDAWSSPEVFARDNWRKEVADAGQFDKARAATVLIEPPALGSALCKSGVGWVIGQSTDSDRYPFLRDAQVVAKQHDTVLWKVAPAAANLAQALSCANGRSQVSPGK